jgi:sulfite dehydrogenase
MKNNLLFIFCLSIVIACNNLANNQPANVFSAPTTNLNSYQTELPNAQGYETFKMNCLSCHSARYIQIQPELSEKNWTAIVTKMQKSFGAPLTDSASKEIVQYLVAIKGKKQR